MSTPQTDSQQELLKEENGISDESSQDESDSKFADIRLCFGPFFLVLIAGKERRSTSRRKEERRVRPVFTVRNVPLLLIIWGSLIFSFYSLVSIGLKSLISII